MPTYMNMKLELLSHNPNGTFSIDLYGKVFNSIASWSSFEGWTPDLNDDDDDQRVAFGQLAGEEMQDNHCHH